jgi:hypothetical protein
VSEEVGQFVALARSGAYLAGDRRVSPKERTRWRFTFRRLATDAQAALAGDDVDRAAAALELLIDLACESEGLEYFRSDDPMQAAGFVVSDAVATLWRAVRDRHGFATFVDRAAPQLLRWESGHGWTRHGWGSVAKQETSLAEVLEAMLQVPDHWRAFAYRYLEVIDEAADPTPGIEPWPAPNGPSCKPSSHTGAVMTRPPASSPTTASKGWQGTRTSTTSPDTSMRHCPHGRSRPRGGPPLSRRRVLGSCLLLDCPEWIAASSSMRTCRSNGSRRTSG